MKIKLKKLPYDLTVCRLASAEQISLSQDFCFIGKTDEEISLVCRTSCVPEHVIERNDGWRCFRVEGPLDFSLTGILSGLSVVLAENGIGIFAVSTFNTDYILVKKEKYDQAMKVLEAAGYEIPDREADETAD